MKYHSMARAKALRDAIERIDSREELFAFILALHDETPDQISDDGARTRTLRTST
jgi:hypothetical protein